MCGRICRRFRRRRLRSRERLLRRRLLRRRALVAARGSTKRRKDDDNFEGRSRTQSAGRSFLGVRKNGEFSPPRAALVLTDDWRRSVPSRARAWLPNDEACARTMRWREETRVSRIIQSAQSQPVHPSWLRADWHYSSG